MLRKNSNKMEDIHISSEIQNSNPKSSLHFLVEIIILFMKRVVLLWRMIFQNTKNAAVYGFKFKQIKLVFLLFHAGLSGMFAPISFLALCSQGT